MPTPQSSPASRLVAALLLASFLAAGCRDEPPSTVCPPCPEGQICNESLGECVDPVTLPGDCDPPCEHGLCTKDLLCDCSGTGGYYGPTCGDFDCDDSPCLNGGVCVGPDTCDCTDTGHTGETCEVPLGVEIFDPYADVDWKSYGQHKANLHTHTTQSDGANTPAQMIDQYRGLGYDILALTDHAGGGHPYAVTWPWTKFGRDPDKLGMVAVQGAEPSDHHHMGSYFSDYDGSAGSAEGSIQAIGIKGGLAVFFHPGRYNEATKAYRSLYLKYSHLVGIEVYNATDRYPGDRALWDYLLAELMPQKPIWGCANDDAHSTGAAGRNWEMFLLPDLSEQAARNALTKGHFYFAHLPAPGGKAPLIQEITADKTAATITIKASDYSSIRWISGGAILQEDTTTLDVSKVQGYVRVELDGPGGGITHTQPFFVGDPSGGTDTLPHGLRVGCAKTVLPCISTDGATVQKLGHRPRAEDGWSTRWIEGSNTTHTAAAQVDATAKSLSANDGQWHELGQSSTWPPSVNAAARWNYNANGYKLQTRPSEVAATVLLAKLVNNTGSTLTQMDVFYDLGSWLVQENEHVPGHRAFFSTSGEPGTWQLISAFSSTGKTSSAGETRLTATLALGTWLPGESMFIMWVDDNGPGGSDNSGTGREGAYTIDNFGVSNVKTAKTN